MRYYTEDWFNIPLLSRAKIPTISVSCVKIDTSVCLRRFTKVFWVTNVITTYRFYIRLYYVIISSLQQLPHPQHHPPVQEMSTLRLPITRDVAVDLANSNTGRTRYCKVS